MRHRLTLAAGWTLVVLGLLVFPLPIPLGLPMMALGLALLLPVSGAARRGLRALRRSMPGFSQRLTEAAKHLPAGLRRIIAITDPGRSRSASRRRW